MAATSSWESYSGWDSSSGAIGNDLIKNNASGFAGLPGGYRDYDGTFGTIGIHGYWWSSTQYNTGDAWGRWLGSDYSGVYGFYDYKQDGASVRCVRDY